MDSIRGSSARSSLRKTKGPPVKSLRKSNSIEKLFDLTTVIFVYEYGGNLIHSYFYPGMRLGYETSRCEEDEFENEENDARRKVTLDPSLVQNMLNFSDDESEEESTSHR